MSDKHSTPAGMMISLTASGVGILISAALMAGMAQWMTSEGFPASSAAPLATVCICAGSFFSGAIAAFCKRERGLWTGTLQGGIVTVLLAMLLLLSGSSVEKMHWIRMGSALLCGCLGGITGVTFREHQKKRTRYRSIRD